MDEMKGLLATVNTEIWRKFKYIAWNKGISTNKLLAEIIKKYIDDNEITKKITARQATLLGQ